MATTHNTATVKLRLDLGELITQLRDLADTLEATQTPKLQDDGPGTPEPDKPEPSHFTDGTKPARNPHTLDLPDGLDPAEAQHMLEVIADFIPKPRNLAETLAGENVAASRDLDPQPLICPQCDDPWHPRAICPTCGCDQR